MEQVVTVFAELFPQFDCGILATEQKTSVELANDELLKIESTYNDKLGVVFSKSGLPSDKLELDEKMSMADLLCFQDNVLFLRQHAAELLECKVDQHLGRLGPLLGCLGTFKWQPSLYSQMQQFVRAMDYLVHREPTIKQVIAEHWDDVILNDTYSEYHRHPTPPFLARILLKDPRLEPLIELLDFACLVTMYSHRKDFEDIYMDVHRAIGISPFLFREEPVVTIEAEIATALAQRNWLGLARLLWANFEDEKDPRFRIGLAALWKMRKEGGTVDGTVIYSLLEPATPSLRRIPEVVSILIGFLDKPDINRLNFYGESRVASLQKGLELSSGVGIWLSDVLLQGKHQPWRKRLALQAENSKRNKAE